MRKSESILRIYSFILSFLIMGSVFLSFSLISHAEAVPPFPSMPTQDVSPLHGTAALDYALGELGDDINFSYNGKDYKPNFCFITWKQNGDSTSYTYRVRFDYFVDSVGCNVNYLPFVTSGSGSPQDIVFSFSLNFLGIDPTDALNASKRVTFDYDSSSGVISNVNLHAGQWNDFRGKQYRYQYNFEPLYLVGVPMDVINNDEVIPFLTPNTYFNWRQPSPITNDLNDLFGGFGNFIEDVDSSTADDLVGNMGSILGSFGAGVFTDKVNENNNSISDLFSGAFNHSSADNGTRGIVEALQASTQAIQAGFNGLAGFMNNFWGNLFSYNVYFFGSVKTFFDNLVSSGLNDSGIFSLSTFFTHLVTPSEEALYSLESLFSDEVSAYNSFYNEFGTIQNTFEDVFDGYDESDFPVIVLASFTIGTITVPEIPISFEWFLDVKPYSDGILSCFLIASYVWFFVTRLPGFIQGIPFTPFKPDIEVEDK